MLQWNQCCDIYANRRVIACIGIFVQCLISLATTVALPIILSEVNCSDGLSSFNRIKIWGIIQGFPSLILYPTVFMIDHFSPRINPSLYEEALSHYVPSSRDTIPSFRAYSPRLSVIPWQCPNSGHFAQHRIEQIAKYQQKNPSDSEMIDYNQQFLTFDIPPPSRQFGPRCTRQVHGVFSAEDHRAYSQREGHIRKVICIIAIVCVLTYFALLIYGTVLYSQNTEFCVLNQSVDKFVLAMVILYWITPLWFPLFISISVYGQNF